MTVINPLDFSPIVVAPYLVTSVLMLRRYFRKDGSGNNKQPEDLVYKITEALWNKNTRELLDNGHAKGKSIVRDNAVKGISVPFHPGAEKFYKEAGLLK